MPTLRFKSCIVLTISFLGLAPAAHSQDEETQTRNALAGIAVLPSKTDPEIKTFLQPHRLHVDRDIVVRHRKDRPAARGQLLVWLTGTNGQGRGAGEFCQTAASEGYHAVRVMYPNTIPATVCKRDADPAAFEKFRMCIIAGGESPHITVSRTESIENRLIKLLELLKRICSQEGWGQYLTAEGNLKWDSLAFAGQSQGGGHALLIAMKHKVARVICTGAPKDWSNFHKGPAAWLKSESATPLDRIFTFNHQQDYQGCTPEQQWVILSAVGLEKFGPLTNVDTTPPPYSHSRMLTTNHPGSKLESEQAHGMVSGNRFTSVMEPVWTYMLTEPEATKPE